jgi:hypothetical protein
VTRESRLIVVLLVIAAIGVSGLLFVGEQYRKALARGTGTEDASARAVRMVDGFLAARAAAKSVVARNPGNEGDVAAAYRIERFNALAARRMSSTDYAAVRAAWRRYRAGEPVTDVALQAAFTARRDELGAADLGASEDLDDAIK